MSAPSFLNYKIDYDTPIGHGKLATVYAVVKRPKNEQNWLSYLFPYTYDYIFRPTPHTDERDPKYCIKIFKTTFQVFLENLSKDMTLILPLMSLCAPWKEKELNKSLREYADSQIEFFYSSFYSQFKTRVHGHTLKHYTQTGKFYSRDGFELRASFVLLLRKIIAAPFILEDVHSKNLMYDEEKNHWEVVDGEVIERESVTKETKLDSFISDLFFEVGDIITHLSTHALHNQPYTKEIDTRFARQWPEPESNWRHKDFQTHPL